VIVNQNGRKGEFDTPQCVDGDDARTEQRQAIAQLLAILSADESIPSFPPLSPHNLETADAHGELLSAWQLRFCL
jgi:hypothetical protein